MKAKRLSLLVLLLVLSLAAIQCTSDSTPEVILQTVEVEKEVIRTVEVEKEVVKTVEVEKEVVRTVEVVQQVEVTPEPPPVQPKGTLKIGLSTFPNSLDMPLAAERNAINASWPLYDSLVWVDNDGNVVPALAESWEISEDGTEYIFHLREGVTFHNGEPFTAKAVVFSWERGSGPEMTYNYHWQEAESVEAVDDYTVKINTGEPKPLFMRIMALRWAIVPPEYTQEVGDEGFAEHPVGTGPFKFVEWAKGDRIVYEANLDYWEEGVPKVEKLIFRPIPESATRVAAIQTGEVDIVQRLTAEEAQSLLGLPDVKVIRYPTDRVFYIAFNNLTTGEGEPTEDPLVRQAMNYAVDVDAIIDALFSGYARPSTGYVSPANFGYDETLEPYGYDPEKAKELLAEAGYPDGFSMGFACPAGAYINFEQVCEAVQGYLADVGIETNLELMESGQYWDLEANKELPPLFGDGWSETSGEALPRLRGALMGWDAKYSAWYDEDLAALLDEIQVTVNDEKRRELYVELQHYMQENPPFIYLYEPFTFEAINFRVQNYHPRPAEDYFLKHTWVLEE